MKRIWIPLLILVVAVVLVVAGCQATRAGYESVLYQVVRASGKFAVRDYPALTVVETPMASGGNERLNVFSSPVYGYFDPPWTPALLRRNEVMLRTDAGK